MNYPSSQDDSIELYAEFSVPDSPRPILVNMHGWHGQVKAEHPDNVAGLAEQSNWFMIRPEMRGRGDATGKPDCNGYELQDIIDAVEFARRRFPDRIERSESIALTGGSGGGGNVMALVGKFPDFFCAAKAECGISDYAMWYRNDETGEFRDELDVWIGCDPDTDEEVYGSRSGLTTVANLLTPIILFHGESDIRVPSEHSRRFVAEAERLGKGNVVTYHEFEGVGNRAHYGNISPEQERLRIDEGDRFLKQHTAPITIPRKGRVVVAGYVKTKVFDVVLESIDRVGAVTYDLDAETFTLESPSPLTAELHIHSDGRDERRKLSAG